MSKDRTKRQESEVLSEQCCKPPLKVYVYRLFLFLLLLFLLAEKLHAPQAPLSFLWGEKTCELEQTCHISFLGFQLREQSLGSAHWEIAMKL